MYLLERANYLSWLANFLPSRLNVALRSQQSYKHFVKKIIHFQTKAWGAGRQPYG